MKYPVSDNGNSLKIGFIGTGNIGQFYNEILSHLANSRQAYPKYDALSFHHTARMIPTAASLAALALALLAEPALAQDQPPSGAMLKKIPISLPPLTPEPMKGQDCSSGPMANAAQLAVNPISGEQQAEPIVAIPLTSASGTIAGVTARAQQPYTCEQARKQ